MPEHTPSFDRLLTALCCQEPDRVPAGEIWVDPEVKEAFLGYPVCSLEDDVTFWYEAGYDYISLDIDLYAATEVQSAITHALADTSGTYQDHRQERNWVTTKDSAITTWDDIERFSWPKADSVDCTMLDDVRKHLPKNMGVLVTTGHVFTLAWQMMGFERFCMGLYDQPDLVEHIIQRLGDEALALLERILAFNTVGAVCFQDDIAYTSGLMVAPAVLKKLFFPWLSQVAALCHAYGHPLIFHSDGKLDDVLPDIVACGVNGIQAIEPKCMDIVAVKEAYGDRLALMGNVDLGYTLTRGTPAEVEAEGQYLIKHVAPGGGFALGSTNSITNYVPLENYRALLDATFKYGRYPITL